MLHGVEGVYKGTCTALPPGGFAATNSYTIFKDLIWNHPGQHPAGAVLTWTEKQNQGNQESPKAPSYLAGDSWVIKVLVGNSHGSNTHHFVKNWDSPCHNLLSRQYYHGIPGGNHNLPPTWIIIPGNTSPYMNLVQLAALSRDQPWHIQCYNPLTNPKNN